MTRIDLRRIEGTSLALRLIEPDDASYLYQLRTNSLYNAHISPVSGSADDQRCWIVDYKNREAAGTEYYYVIERRDGLPCGVVRLYDINQRSFTWGSWILDHNKTPKAALESAVLSLGAGFDMLDLDRAYVDVRVTNERAHRFYIRLGMTEIRRDERDIFLSYERSIYERDRALFASIIEGDLST